MANVDGGLSRGGAYLQRVGLIGDADLDRLIGWPGAAAHISVHLIAGAGISGGRVGNVLTVSGLEAEPAARLFNLWIEQKFGQQGALKVGLFTAGQEFAVSPTATLLINSTFGWPASFATDLPSGGPAYPLAAPGVRLSVTPRDGLAARLAVFAGDPAGPGAADPQRRDRHGFNSLRFKGRAFVIGEVARSALGDDPAWTVTLGGWVHGNGFDDVAVDDQGGPLSAPGSSGKPLAHRGDWAIYAMADGRLWRSARVAPRGFLRVSASPSNRNPLDLYLDGGISAPAPVRARKGDVIGVGVAIGRISPALRAQARDRAAQLEPAPVIARYEAVIETSWQLKLGPRLALQPNVQVVFHPAAALLAGDISAASLPSHAVVVGLRTSARL